MSPAVVPAVSLRAFVALVTVQILALLAGLVLVDPRARPLVYATAFVVASLPWIWMSWAVLSGRSRITWTQLVVAVVLLRLVVQLAAPAVLSDDIWRYLWEGRIQLAGYNPFVDSPAELEVLGRGDSAWERMNNREISAAYPAFGQLFLRLLAALELHAVGTRIAFALLDLATFFLLALALSRSGLDRCRSLVHGLCPLPIVELCVEGHNDALGIALLVGAFACMASVARRDRLAGLSYGCAIAAKYLPLLLIPWLLRTGRKTLVAIAVVAAVMSFAFYWPGIARLDEMFAGLGEYGARWRHNDSGFVVLRAATVYAQELLRDVGVTSWIATAHEDRVAKIPMAVVFAIGLFWIFRRVRDPRRAFVAILLLLFAIAPTVHPWYLCWLVPFLAFAPHPAAFALIAMSGFSYHVLARFHHGDGKWVEQPLWKIVEYAPFYVLLIAAIVRSRKTSENRVITASGENRDEYAS